MKRFALAAFASLIAGTAGAALPVFVAICPGDISVDSGRTGVVYVNGTKVTVKEFNENYYEVKSGAVTISIASDPGQAPIVSYTGKGGANGVCEVTGYEPEKAAAASSEPSTAERAGLGQFDATGQIPCAQSKGQPMGQCKFGVARGGNGSATVVVTRPDGRTRAIFFDNGKAFGADLSQADGDMTFRASKSGDLFMIQAGKERYEIPDAVIFGG
jgi:hypothetical protein